MVLHIGIVGCSAEGAALCYRTICAEGPALLGPHAHPEISLHTPSFAEYVAALTQGDMEEVAALMLRSAERLALAGADVLICPDNTIHQAFDLVMPRTPLPWLHIADVVAEAAAARGFTRLGLTGTAWLLDSGVYPARLARRGMSCIAPPAEDRALMHRIIMEELVAGVIRPEARTALQAVMGRLRAAGAEAAILGCTEIPLLIGEADAPLPVLDSTRLLARAALRRAVQG